jgi:hypothetical protein
MQILTKSIMLKRIRLDVHSHEHPGIRNDKKERSRADRLEVVESCIGWREWHMRDLALRGADRSRIMM